MQFELKLAVKDKHGILGLLRCAFNISDVTILSLIFEVLFQVRYRPFHKM